MPSSQLRTRRRHRRRSMTNTTSFPKNKSSETASLHSQLPWWQSLLFPTTSMSVASPPATRKHRWMRRRTLV